MHLIPAVTPWGRHGPAPSADGKWRLRAQGSPTSMHLIPAVTPWRRHGPAPSTEGKMQTQGSGLAHVHALNPRRDPVEKARPCPLRQREMETQGSGLAHRCRAWSRVRMQPQAILPVFPTLTRAWPRGAAHEDTGWM